MQTIISKSLNVWFDGVNYFGTKNRFEKTLLSKIDMIKLKIYFNKKINILDKIWVYVGNYYTKEMFK